MRFELPHGHGLSETIQRTLLFRSNGAPAVSNAQYEALTAGVGRGESMLVVSPTSTGKTHIALWAIASSLGGRLQYRLSGDASSACKQKFEDFKATVTRSISRKKRMHPWSLRPGTMSRMQTAKPGQILCMLRC